MPSAYESLLTRVHEIHDLNKAQGVLSWDREVNMPPKGLPARIRQMSTLRRLSHEKYTSDEMGEHIDAAAEEVADCPYDSVEASLIRLLQRTYADARKLPSEFVVRVTEVGGQAHAAWVKARQENDFAAFQPWLEQVVDLGREMADLYGYDQEPYDPLFDKYEHGMTTAEVRAIFDGFQQELVPLREAIAQRGKVIDDSIVHQPFDVEKQREFALYIAEQVGYDFSRGHLGTAVHPFATSFSRDDARITTRWYPNFLNPSLFGTLHESGHAMYEQGTAPELARTPLARGTSSGIHESQSRMIENIVGRSRGFWQAHYPKLRSCFPEQLGEVSLEDFYRAINVVEPSFIRVEADEVTYNLHIILRFELELAMMHDELSIADLPTAWNDKMNALLGVVPPTDREGVLQDVHWSRPSFGYFPTYALGNLYAAQFYQAAREDDPAVEEALNQGQTEPLLAWLRENIHQHGKKFTAAEITERATGRPLSYKPYMAYITEKFGEIYGL